MIITDNTIAQRFFVFLFLFLFFAILVQYVYCAIFV